MKFDQGAPIFLDETKDHQGFRIKQGLGSFKGNPAIILFLLRLFGNLCMILM